MTDEPENTPVQTDRSGDGPPEILPEHYVESGTSLAERPIRVLKHGGVFAVVDTHGEIGDPLDPGHSSSEGLFYRDTRHLSHFRLTLEGRPLLLLSSIIQDDNAALSVDLTNSDIHAGGSQDGPIRLVRDTIYVGRIKFLYQGACYERIGLRNFSGRRQRFTLTFTFDADFRDLFEVRGEHRRRRGRRSMHVHLPDRVEYRYEGLDGLTRGTILEFDPAPARLGEHRAEYATELAPNARTSLFVTTCCTHG